MWLSWGQVGLFHMSHPPMAVRQAFARHNTGFYKFPMSPLASSLALPESSGSMNCVLLLEPGSCTFTSLAMYGTLCTLPSFVKHKFVITVSLFSQCLVIKFSFNTNNILVQYGYIMYCKFVFKSKTKFFF